MLDKNTIESETNVQLERMKLKINSENLRPPLTCAAVSPPSIRSPSHVRT